MKKPAVILVQRSRRPRRWAGVAMFAALLAGVLCVEHARITPPAHGPLLAPTGQESFESVLGRNAADDHSAQLTDFAFKSSDSTEGATPTR
jgi:hypothetical protein